MEKKRDFVCDYIVHLIDILPFVIYFLGHTERHIAQSFNTKPGFSRPRYLCCDATMAIGFPVKMVSELRAITFNLSDAAATGAREIGSIPA